MKNILIIIKKQIKDTVKNKTILVEFIMFPLLTLIMENAIKLENMPELFFTKLFSIMYIGMAPLTAAAAIISEEKEKNTLRVLIMANVKPWQYLAGLGIYIWTICMAGAILMATGLDDSCIPFYLVLMGTGFLLSIAAGACIGIYAKNQMISTSLVMPAILILSFIPMLAMFNEKIARPAKILYTQQLRIFLDKMTFSPIQSENVIILVSNAVIIFLLFFLVFKKKGLE